MREDRLPAHSLAAMVCFSGLHYVAYCATTPSPVTTDSGDGDVAATEWVCFDDSVVKPVGSWSKVMERVARARQMPVLLFYHQVV